MANGKRANTRKTSVKRDKNGKWIKGTPSPNPAGRPPLGESYKEILAAAGNLTIKELRERYPTYNRFDSVADDVKLKELVSLSVLVALACEPSPGMLATLLDRTDGPLEHTININKMTDEEIANAIKPILERLGIWLEPPHQERIQSEEGGEGEAAHVDASPITGSASG